MVDLVAAILIIGPTAFIVRYIVADIVNRNA